MTYFKLNIPKLNESISKYKNSKKECLDDVNIVYRGLGYTESAWNDLNARNFIERIKIDRNNIHEYFNYLDRLYGELNQFKNNIDDICVKQGYRRNYVTLKFDDSDINDCKKYLNNAIFYLNDSLNKININSFGSNFQNIQLIYTLRSEIKSMKKIINEIIDDINSFTKSINNELYNSSYRMKRIVNHDFKLEKINYNWKIVDMNIKRYISK